MAGSLRSLPLPDDPTLATWASALNETGHWAYVLDTQWRYVWLTDEMRLTYGDTTDWSSELIGSHYFGGLATQFLAPRLASPSATREARRAQFARLGPYALASTPGDREELRRIVDPDLADLIDELEPQ